MAVPSLNPGDVLTAAYLDAWLFPLAAYKTSAEHRITTTTLANDSALFLPVAANATYDFSCFLHYQGGTLAASDMKCDFTYPAGATMTYALNAFNAAGNDLAPTGWTQANFPLILGTSGAGNFRAAVFNGTVTTVAAAGTLQFRFAQNTSNATDTVVNTGSKLTLQRIG